MRLLLISPSWLPTFWNGGKVLTCPTSLPVLASLTPPDAEIHLVDENVEPVDLAAPADLVAITSMTASAPRGYEIADHFRERGVPVVMGGMHPSALPEEAAEHADAVVVGEAENQWARVVADFAAGRPQQFYRTAERPDLTDLPIPRRDLLRTDRYLTVNLVQTARGCPYACTFCSVSPTFGRRYRFRPIPEVIEEIRSLHSPWVVFPDDNIVASRGRAKELFEALIPLKLRWLGQGDLSMANDEELLKLMARSGCIAMYIGLESLSQESLTAARKRVNLGVDYEQAIGTIHRHGIDIVGSFVFGLDPDRPDVFQRTVEFAERVKLALAHFCVLTPFPGTPLHDQLKQEHRITNTDWSDYTMGTVVYRPRNMTAAQLHHGHLDAYRRFYSRRSILRRTLVWRGSARQWPLRMTVNHSYRRLHQGGKITDSIPGEPATNDGTPRRSYRAHTSPADAASESTT
ncbi:MAG: radical SAM protein [Armatimonadota bacterium]